MKVEFRLTLEETELVSALLAANGGASRDPAHAATKKTRDKIESAIRSARQEADRRGDGRVVRP